MRNKDERYQVAQANAEPQWFTTRKAAIQFVKENPGWILTDLKTCSMYVKGKWVNPVIPASYIVNSNRFQEVVKQTQAELRAADMALKVFFGGVN